MTPAATLAGVAGDWLRAGRRVVRALLVETDGSAPLPPGASMLVDDRGTVEGSITGGCVESAVAQEAERVLAERAPRLVSYGIADELAGEVGLMCGGTVHVFVHELAAGTAETELAALAAAGDGRPVALATLLDGAHAGAKLAVIGEETTGTLHGGALFDRNVARDAAGLLGQGVTAIRTYGAEGATLGSELRVHVQAFAPPPQMVVFGAIDFSAALAPLAKELGYAVTICDARERFARSPRFARAAEVVVAWPAEALAGRTLGPRDAVLVFTHDPKFDEPALLAAFATGAGYIGALGSRRTTAARSERLRAAGATDAQLARVHAPCGLDIGGRTPHEVAVSVLAEIIAERAGRSGGPLRATSGTIQARDHERWRTPPAPAQASGCAPAPAPASPG